MLPNTLHKNVNGIFRFFILISLVIVSCSGNQFRLSGVWSNVEKEGDSTKTVLLVFRPNNTGAKIYKTSLTSGEITSTINMFNWKMNDDLVVIKEEGDKKESFLVNDTGEQLKSKKIEDIFYTKVSEDLSKY